MKNKNSSELLQAKSYSTQPTSALQNTKTEIAIAKNKNYLSQLILLMMLLFLINNPTLKAQNFLAATNIDYQSGTMIVANNTGCDNIELTMSAGTLNVSVCDDVSNNMGARFYSMIDNNNSATSIGLFYADAIDPDVCIVYDGFYSVYYALVVYYSSTASDVVFEIYSDGGNNGYPFSFVSATPLGIGATVLNTINIDSDPYGNFAIVWDEVSNNEVITIAGDVQTNQFPTLSPNGVVNLTNSIDAVVIQPDVSIGVEYAYTYPGPGGPVIHYTYIDQSGKIVYAHEEWWQDIYAGNAYYYPFQINNSGGNNNPSYPRICCAPVYGSNGTYDEFTVVWQDYNGGASSYDIFGYTQLAGTSYYNNYTSGSPNSPVAINTVSNVFPVVSYNDDYANMTIMVGWVSDATDTYFAPTSCLALKCTADGFYDNTVPKYLTVPYVNPSQSGQSALSIAGRNSSTTQLSNMLYAFYDNGFNDLFFKMIPFSSTTLRIAANSKPEIKFGPSPFGESLTMYCSNCTDEILCLSLLDITGRCFGMFEGDVNLIEDKLKDLSKELNSGIYILQLKDKEGMFNVSQKVIKL